MIVVLKPGVSEAQIECLSERLESLGYQSQRIQTSDRTVLATIGNGNGVDIRESIGRCDGVDRLVFLEPPYRVASSAKHPTRTIVKAGSLVVGGAKVAVIAGPCSVETEEQIIRTARAVKAAGADALRGGAFKPRTSPYSFQGLGEEGLKLLALAKKETGLPIVTEVMSPDKVDLVSEYGDVLQIGARNMQNYALLRAVGAQPKPILLKRGPSATLDEFLLAAEYILDQGNSQVILCERGIRTFEDHTRFTLPIATVPYLHEKTHLPVLVDPSHGTGLDWMVGSLSSAAIAAGADGLLIEVHPDPERAWSDSTQQLTLSSFDELMKKWAKVAVAVDRIM